MKLSSSHIEALQEYLWFDKKHSDTRQNRNNLRSRFQFLQKWFEEQDLEFNRENFTKFVKYMREHSYSNATINNFIKLAKHIDKKFEVNQLQDYSYFPKDNTPPDVLTAEQVAQMININLKYDRESEAKNIRYRAILHTMFLTGGRINEILSLTWNDIKKMTLGDGREAFVLVLNQTKIKEKRYAAITEELYNSLMDLPHHSQYIFSTPKGDQVNRQTVSDDLKARAKVCGINRNVYNHIIRHSFIRFMLRSGAPLHVVSHMIGHKSVETTYRHYTDGLIAEYVDTLYGFHPHLKKHQTLDTVEKRIKDMIHSVLDLNRFSVIGKRKKKKLNLEIIQHD